MAQIPKRGLKPFTEELFLSASRETTHPLRGWERSLLATMATSGQHSPPRGIITWRSNPAALLPGSLFVWKGPPAGYFWVNSPPNWSVFPSRGWVAPGVPCLGGFLGDE